MGIPAPGGPDAAEPDPSSQRRELEDQETVLRTQRSVSAGNTPAGVAGPEDEETLLAISPPAGQAPRSTGDLEAGHVIGRYHLLQKIGEGGMGDVWEADQHEPVRRRVALKLIKQGMDTRQVVARFESERQALAVMDHPFIAQVFDAGSTDRGRPYFVMEYVKGVPISEYCDRRRLDTRARLALFMQVCEGVQHAHHKAIIHRDLKPSNILIALHGDKATPKIIDFGVAKATSRPLTDSTMFTELGQFIGTPEYMSPEQAEMGGQDIDTRTDVYALGAILYELLVGALPFDAGPLRRAGLDEIRRHIIDVDPPTPSARFPTLGGEAAATSARNRSTDVSTLRRQLRGDLDWIVMKAMEKDRSRRYGSPMELAADIGRYLASEPIAARPPSTTYRMQKFVRRHTGAVAAAGTLASLLVAFAVVMAVQAGRIAAERDRANQEAAAATRVSSFLTGLFRVSDPGEARGNSITAREILDQGADSIHKTLADQPAIQARLMDTMGEVYRNLGLYAPATPLLSDALQTRRHLLGDDHPDVLRSMQQLGILYYQQGRFDEAEPLLADALAKRRRVLGPEDPDTLDSMNSLANLYLRSRRTEEAEPLYVTALAAQRRILDDDDPATLKTMNNLAALYKRTRQFELAEPLARDALASRRRVLGDDHPSTLNALQNLAVINTFEGDFDQAEPLFEEALATRRRVLGEEHPETLLQMNNLAEFYRMAGKAERAEPLLVSALATQRRVLGNDHPSTFAMLDTLAHVYMDEKRFDAAEPLFQEALEGRARVLGPADRSTIESLNAMIALCDAKGHEKMAGHYRERLARAMADRER
ncbi:MAG: tetratricopeptide repeat protein [Acidobacteriota bacterium]